MATCETFCSGSGLLGREALMVAHLGCGTEACWLDEYDRPLRACFPALLARHGHSDAARASVAAEEHEIALYERHKAHVSYGFYSARKL